MTTADRVLPPALSIRGITASNPFVLAPMDGYSDLPFRLLCRRAGAGLCYSEMISSIPLTMGGRDSTRRARSTDDDHPLIAQIVGHDPDVMARAARAALDAGADGVDVNAGCPSRRVTNGGSGAALLSDLRTLAHVLEAVRAAIRAPLTLKVRSGPVSGHVVLDEVARIARDTGVDAVTVHPRSRAQGFSGLADWALITRFKHVCTVPVIGNGDVMGGADALRMFRETGCDAVMVGRGAVGDPWIFTEMDAAWRGLTPPPRPAGTDLLKAIAEHFDMLAAYVGDEARAAGVFRKHLVRYVRGLPGATQFRRGLNSVTSRGSLMRALAGVAGDDGGGPPGGAR